MWFRGSVFLAALVLAVLATACGASSQEGPNPEDLTDSAQIDPDQVDTDQTTAPPEPVRAETQVVSWSDAGAQRTVALTTFRPETTCTDSTPCPLVVLIPDHLDAGLDTLTPHGASLARQLKSVVAIYNAPGRGSGWDKSSGEEDFHGISSQDALVRVIKEASMLSFVDPERVGMVCVGFGLSAAVGALGRFHETGLAEVDFLIDVEGPTNRCFMSQSPFAVNQSEGWYINEDGTGWQSPGRCDFDLHSRKEKFPSGTSADGKGTDGGTPNSYICSKYAFPLAQAGVTCDDDDFFKTREPKVLLNRIGVHYLRLQFLYDHEQPTRMASLEAIHFASTNTNIKSIQLNNLPLDQPNLAQYSEKQLLDAKAFLSIKGVGNGFGTGAYSEGAHSVITAQELWLTVLPGYIKRMQERAEE